MGRQFGDSGELREKRGCSEAFPLLSSEETLPHGLLEGTDWGTDKSRGALVPSSNKLTPVKLFRREKGEDAATETRESLRETSEGFCSSCLVVLWSCFWVTRLRLRFTSGGKGRYLGCVRGHESPGSRKLIRPAQQNVHLNTHRRKSPPSPKPPA